LRLVSVEPSGAGTPGAAGSLAAPADATGAGAGGTVGSPGSAGGGGSADPSPGGGLVVVVVSGRGGSATTTCFGSAEGPDQADWIVLSPSPAARRAATW